MKTLINPYLRRRILHILMALCVMGILTSAFVLLSDIREYRKGDASYQQLRSLGISAEQADSSHQTINEQSNRVDFDVLKEVNEDVAGWLIAEGTEIDYPVVQGEDNDFYLRHLFTGERNKLGSIFMDYRNNKDFLDKNTIIYGHNMKDGSMFSSLTMYKDQRYYDDAPTMLLYTPSGAFTIEWFAGIVVDGDYESVRYHFIDDQDFQSYIHLLRENSTFESDTVIEADDRIITLCTCSYEFNNARYALYGKLVK